MYQFTEITFSPSFNLNSTSSYNNKIVLLDDIVYTERFDEETSNGTIGNIGYISSNARKDNEWKRLNFGVGYNLLANYDKNIYINTLNNSSSLADNLLFIAQGNTINQLDAFLVPLHFGLTSLIFKIIPLTHH